MDWKKQYYFRDSTAHTWASSDRCTSVSENFVIKCNAGTSAVSDYAWSSDASTAYMTKVETIHTYMTIFSGGVSSGYINGITGEAYGAVYGSFTHLELTPEQKAAQAEHERVYAEEVKKADHKARLLFLKIAGKHRYRLLKKNGHFDIVGKSGQRYRLAVGEKVRVMKGCFGDEAEYKLCAYVPDVPAVDTLLAQYLALTCGVEGETEFAKIAIKHAA